MGFNLKIIIVAALISMAGVKLSKADHDVELVPAHYIMEHHIIGEAYDVNYFLLRLCGGCRYDKQNLKVLLILQKQKWSQENGDFLNAIVMDASGKAISTNQIGSDQDPKWVQTFSFTYHAFYGDLKLKVVNGPGSGMVYTIRVKFDKCNVYCSEERSFMSYIESRNQWEQRIAAAENRKRIHDLVQIFETTEPSAVKTGDLKYFQFDYCFPSPNLKYSLSVTALPADSKSVLATYACPKGITGCENYTSLFQDKASSTNKINISISGRESVRPVTVIVRGDGSDEKMNTFTVSASKYIEV